MNKYLDAHKDAYREGFKFHDENILMLSWYAERIIRVIKEKGLKSVISLGIGHGIVSKRMIHEAGRVLQNYVILEGSQKIAEEFEREVVAPPNVSVVNTFFEEFHTQEKFDAIEMGFVLEHVDDPLCVLKKFVGFLKAGGSLFVAVPNAKSLHRLVGCEAGLLDNIYRLSEHDFALGHKRYFDLISLTKLLLDSGLKINVMEGIFLKPFSTAQLNSMGLSSQVLSALLSIAHHYPEISNAIYAEATILEQGFSLK